LIRKHEGLALQTYNDNGHPAIGYGHDLLPSESYPDGISVDQAEALLTADIAKAIDAVKRLVTVPLSDNQLAALTDFVYALGPGDLERSTLLQDLNQGNYAAVPDQLARWDYLNGAPSQQVEALRQNEIDLWNQDSTAPAVGT